MGITVCQYSVEMVSSRRTHQEGIDIKCDANRVFLSDELAKELILAMTLALNTPWVEE